MAGSTRRATSLLSVPTITGSRTTTSSPLKICTRSSDVDTRMGGPQEMKTCSKCKQTKPLTEFQKDRSRLDGLQRYCRSCSNTASSESKANDPGRHRRYKYGLADAEYLTMLVLQDSQCAICETDFSPGQTTCAHVDHEHGTDRVRGLLCSECNIGLGKFKDDPTLLHAAAEYLVAA